MKENEDKKIYNGNGPCDYCNNFYERVKDHFRYIHKLQIAIEALIQYEDIPITGIVAVDVNGDKDYDDFYIAKEALEKLK